MPKEQNICLPLPNTIDSNIVTSEWREQSLITFLNNTLPPSDTKSIGTELDKALKLNKHRAKKPRVKKGRKETFYSSRKCILLGLNKSIGKQDLSYEDILPLNNLWQGYMKNLLGIKDFSEINVNPISANYETTSQRLMKADYHGAEVRVVRSKCPSLVGVQGIIIQDTKNLFRLISKDNVIRSIPKESSIFSIYFNDVILDVEGRDFCIRPAERSVKKLKSTSVNSL